MLTDTLAALTRLEVVRTDPSVGTFPMLSSFCIPNTLLGELWGQGCGSSRFPSSCDSCCGEGHGKGWSEENGVHHIKGCWFRPVSAYYSIFRPS